MSLPQRKKVLFKIVREYLYYEKGKGIQSRTKVLEKGLDREVALKKIRKSFPTLPFMNDKSSIKIKAKLGDEFIRAIPEESIYNLKFWFGKGPGIAETIYVASTSETKAARLVSLYFTGGKYANDIKASDIRTFFKEDTSYLPKMVPQLKEECLFSLRNDSGEEAVKIYPQTFIE